MKSIKVLLNFFNRSKIKTLIIIIQIVLSVYFLTFFLIPLIKNLDTLNLISNVDLQDKALFIESLHIKSSYSTGNSYTNYNQMNNYLNNLDEIKSSSGVIQVHTQKSNINTFLYDIPFCYNINLPLYKGEWIKEEHITEDIIPVIVSYSLKEQYPINSIIDLKFEGKQLNTYKNKKVKVVGILKNNGYMFIGGSSNSTAGLSDWFVRIKDDNIMILPNTFDISELSYIAYPGRIIELKNSKTDLEKIEKDVNAKGLGKVYSIEELKKNSFYNLYDLNSELIYQFIVIIIFILASIGGYNTLETLNYKRILTIYYINGMEWDKGIKLIIIKNLLLIIAPALITSVICSKSLSQAYQIPFDFRVIGFTFIIYFILYIATTLGTILSLKRIKPIEVLKEVD